VDAAPGSKSRLVILPNGIISNRLYDIHMLKVLRCSASQIVFLLIGLMAFETTPPLYSATLNDEGKGKPCEVGFATSRLKTSEGELRLDEYYRKDAPRQAKILFIHGAEGLLSATPAPDIFDNGGEHKLACSGFDVFIPHYFEVSGRRSMYSISDMEAQSPRWLLVLEQTLAHVISQDHSPRVFVYGRSLGGFLALQLASHHHNLAGLIVVSAGLRNGNSLHVSDLPPTLIVHGADDQIVPAAQAKALNDAPGWRVTHRLVLLRHGGHNLYFMSDDIAQFIIDFSHSIVDRRPSNEGRRFH